MKINRQQSQSERDLERINKILKRNRDLKQGIGDTGGGTTPWGGMNPILADNMQRGSQTLRPGLTGAQRVLTTEELEQFDRAQLQNQAELDHFKADPRGHQIQFDVGQQNNAILNKQRDNQDQARRLATPTLSPYFLPVSEQEQLTSEERKRLRELYDRRSSPTFPNNPEEEALVNRQIAQLEARASAQAGPRAVFKMQLDEMRETGSIPAQYIDEKIYTGDNSELGTWSGTTLDIQNDFNPNHPDGTPKDYNNKPHVDSFWTQSITPNVSGPAATLMMELEDIVKVTPENYSHLSSAFTTILGRWTDMIATYELINQADPELRILDEKERTLGTYKSNLNYDKMPDNFRMYQEQLRKEGEIRKVSPKEMGVRKAINRLRGKGPDSEYSLGGWNNLEKETFLRWMARDGITQLRRLMNPPNLFTASETMPALTPMGQTFSTDQVPLELNREYLLGAAIIEYFTRKGYFTFGFDEQGRIIPMNTSANPLIDIDPYRIGVTKSEEQENINQEEVERAVRENEFGSPFEKNITSLQTNNAMWFPDMRRGATAPLASRHPPKDGKMQNAGENMVLNQREGIRLKSPNADNDYLMESIRHTPIGTDGTSLGILNWALDQVIGEGLDSGKFLDHPLTPMLTEATRNHWLKYARKRGHAQGFREVYGKIKLFEKELNQVKNRAVDWELNNAPRYMNVHESIITGRINYNAYDLNPAARKATHRPTMAFDVDPITVNREMLDRNKLKDLAESVWSSNKKGKARGYEILSKMKGETSLNITIPTSGTGTDRTNYLNRTGLFLLDYYHALGNTLIKMNPNYSVLDLVNPLEVTKFAIDNEMKVLELSKFINEHFPLESIDKTTGKFKEPSKIKFEDPNFPEEMKHFLKKKGEFQYPIEIIREVARLNDVRKRVENGGPGIRHKFVYKFSMDQAMSNAALEGMVMGDLSTLAILGVLPEGYIAADEEHSFHDLRDVIFSAINEDVKDVITGHEQSNDPGILEAFLHFFDEFAKQDPNAAKTYGKELSTAALYGKPAVMMYSEAQNILNSVGDKRSQRIMSNGEPDNRTLYEILREPYTFQGNMEQLDPTQNQMLRDLTRIMKVSCGRVLGRLLTYANYQKDVGHIIGLFGLPTTMEAWGGQKVQAAITNFVGSHEAAEILSERTGLSQFKRKRSKAGDVEIADIQRIQNPYAPAPSKEARARTSYIKDRKMGINSHMPANVGTNVQNSLGVILIQAGDKKSVALTKSIVSDLNSPVPEKVITIHDDYINGPGAGIKTHITFNNIVMPTLAGVAPSTLDVPFQIMRKGMNKVEAEINKLPGGPNAKVVDIGTSPIYLEGRNRPANLFGIPSFFDTLYDMWVRNDFYTEYELTTRPSVAAKAKKQSDRLRHVLDKAMENGYIPPNSSKTRVLQVSDANMNMRRQLKITKQQALDLIQIMRELTRSMPKDTPDSKLILDNPGARGDPRWTARHLSKMGGERGAYGRDQGRNDEFILEMLENLKDYGYNLRS